MQLDKPIDQRPPKLEIPESYRFWKVGGERYANTIFARLFTKINEKCPQKYIKPS
jgi:hypothetical protein